MSVDSLERLTRDLGDELEVLISMQYNEILRFSRRGYQEIGDRCRAMLTSVSQ